VDVVVGSGFVRQSSATCSHGSPDQSTFSATEESAHNRSADRRTAHDLRARVVPVVAFFLRGCGSAMAPLSLCFLCVTNKWQQS
jgi:hypothetical protein